MAVSGGWYLPDFDDWAGTASSHQARIEIWITSVSGNWLHNVVRPFANSDRGFQHSRRLEKGPTV
jgi:hypothetical protein